MSSEHPLLNNGLRSECQIVQSAMRWTFCYPMGFSLSDVRNVPG
jgi:hypothetical protein